MSTFPALVLFYFKRLSKSYTYMGLMIFMVIVLASRIIIYHNQQYDYMNYHDFVGEMTVIVQALMLFIMVFFYTFLTSESRYGSRSLLGGSISTLIYEILALIVNHIGFMLLFVILQLGIILGFFYSSEIPFSSFYYQTTIFVIVYWFLPFILSCLIGVLIALWFGRKKVSFVILLVFWIISGPMNTTIFSFFFSDITSESSKNLFYIGPYNMSASYISPLGYNVTLSSFLKILFWIVVITAMILCTLLALSRTALQRYVMFSLILTLGVVNGVIYMNLFKDGQPTFHFAEKKKEISFYKKHNIEAPPDQFNYDIQTYQISLDLKEKPTAKVMVELKNVNSEAITFSLYHKYPLEEIVDQNGSNVLFRQDGDFVTVNRKNNHQSEKLTFYYTLKNSYMFPVSSNYLYLPNYLNWIPKKSDNETFSYYKYVGVEDSIKSNSNQSTDLIEYSLDIKDNLKDPKLKTNLAETKGNSYQGKVSGGITVTAGEITTETINGDEIVHPNSWSDLSNDWAAYKDVLERVHEETIELFGLDEQPIPKQYFLINPSGEYNSYLSSDHAVIQHGTLLNISSALNEVPELYVPALLWNRDKRSIDHYDQVSIFNSLTANYLKSNLDIEDHSIIPPWDGFITVPETFSTKYDGLSQKEKKRFLNLWYAEMQNLSSWSDTEKLFDQI